MINVTSYSKKKQTGTGTSSDNSTGGVAPTILTSSDIQATTIWGLTHDHTQKNVDGDLTAHGNITSVGGDITATPVTKNQYDDEGNVSGTYQEGGNIIGANADIDGTVEATSVKADDANILSIDSQHIDAGQIDAIGVDANNLHALNGYIEDLQTNTLTSQDATINNLKVTGQAHFFELVIDKIKAAGGAVIFSPADGFTIDYVRYTFVYKYKVNVGYNQSGNPLNITFKKAYNLPVGYYPVFFDNSKDIPALITDTYDLETGEWIFVRKFSNNALYLIENEKCYDTIPQSQYLDGTYQLMFKSINVVPDLEEYLETYRSQSKPDYFDYPSISLYWQAKDPNTGRARVNMWEIDDQLICQNFNQAVTGSTSNVRNKYYWGLVTAAPTVAQAICDETPCNYDDSLGAYTSTEMLMPVDCHMISFNAKTTGGITGYALGNPDPEPGDGIAMLGSRTGDTAREQAIYISCYNSIDSTINAPLFAQYRGINTFSLSGKAVTYFSRDKNLISGDTVMVAGKDIMTQLNELVVDSLEIDQHVVVLTPVEQFTTYSYDDWLNAVGTEVQFGSNPTDADAFDSEIKVGAFVFIEQTYILDTTTGGKVTLYGKVTDIRKSTTSNYRQTKVMIYMVLNASLQDLYDKYSELSVTTEGITATVADLNTGLSNLSITVNGISGRVTNVEGDVSTLSQTAEQIQSNVTNLQNDMSTITQTANDISLRVNNVELKVNENKIVLNGNTEVNGTVNINQDGTGFRLNGSNGEQFTISSSDIGTYSNFESKTNDSWWETGSKTVNFANSTKDYESFIQMSTVPITIKPGQSISVNNVFFTLENYSLGNTTIYKASIEMRNVLGDSGGTMAIVNLMNYGLNSSTTSYTYQGNMGLTGSKTALINYTNDTTSNIDVYFTFSYKLRGSQANTSCRMDIGAALAKTVDAFGNLTYNGFGFNFGGGKLAFIGNDSMVFKAGTSSGIKIDSTGIKKLVPINSSYQSMPLNFLNAGQWVPIDYKNVRYLYESTGVRYGTIWFGHPDDSMLVVSCTTYPIIIILPSAADNIGKTITIKDIGSSDKVYAGTELSTASSNVGHIIKHNSYTGVSDAVGIYYSSTNSTSHYYGLDKIGYQTKSFTAVTINGVGWWVEGLLSA